MSNPKKRTPPSGRRNKSHSEPQQPSANISTNHRETKRIPDFPDHVIERMPLSLLKPAPYNPRTISPEALRGLSQSLRRFGLVQPILWNKRTGYVIGGHQRITALRSAGRSEAEVIVLDLSETEEKSLNLTLNNPHISGEFTDGLQDILASLKIESGPEFEDLCLNELFIETIHLPEAGEHDDDVAEAPKEPETKPGDLFSLGRHRLLCGDATNIDHFKRLVGESPIDLLFTDPPYGVSIVKASVGSTGSVGGGGTVKFGSIGGGKIVEAKKYPQIIGDDTTESAKAAYELAFTAGIKNHIIWGGNYFADFLPPSSCWIVWDKQNTGNFADVELAWTSYEKGAKLYPWLWNGLSRAGNRQDELISRVHPTQKPVGLFLKIFADFQAQTVLDLFGGSGSTLIACERAGRQCFMMEMSPAYCDVIKSRWEKITGEKAELLS